MKKEEPQSVQVPLKVELAREINSCLADRHLPQHSAAELLNVAQPKISALVNYRLKGFSVEKLMGLLTLLDRDVEIRISPQSVKGRVHVSAA